MKIKDKIKIKIKIRIFNKDKIKKVYKLINSNSNNLNNSR
jgi:hypothetical protein